MDYKKSRVEVLVLFLVVVHCWCALTSIKRTSSSCTSYPEMWWYTLFSAVIGYQ